MRKLVAFILFTMVLSVVTGRSEENSVFAFSVSKEEVNTSHVNDFDNHLLGDVIARKLHVVKNLYTMRYDTKVGIATTEIEVRKPDILRSVEKADKYFKSAVRKNQLEQTQAINNFSDVLDTAYTLFFEEESAEFEKALSKAKKTEEILELYRNIQWNVPGMQALR